MNVILKNKAISIVGDILENEQYDTDNGKFDYGWYFRNINELDIKLTNKDKWEMVMLCFYITKKIETIYEWCNEYGVIIERVWVGNWDSGNGMYINIDIMDYNRKKWNEFMECFNDMNHNHWIDGVNYNLGIENKELEVFVNLGGMKYEYKTK